MYPENFEEWMNTVFIYVQLRDEDTIISYLAHYNFWHLLISAIKSLGGHQTNLRLDVTKSRTARNPLFVVMVFIDLHTGYHLIDININNILA